MTSFLLIVLTVVLAVHFFCASLLLLLIFLSSDDSHHYSSCSSLYLFFFLVHFPMSLHPLSPADACCEYSCIHHPPVADMTSGIFRAVSSLPAAGGTASVALPQSPGSRRSPVGSMNNNNNNRIQRRYSRFFTISSQRRELSSTRTLKWPGRNRVQITCNTSSAFHVQVSCYVPRGTKGQLSY